MMESNQLEVPDLVEALALEPHPEGGWFREVYRSQDQFEGSGEFPAGRNICTSIFFLITAGNFSAFHRIKSDETWHFYLGDPLEIVEITPAGALHITMLGNDVFNGELLQYTVMAGCWFASRLAGEGSYALTGCTVSPGFDFRDFELASRMRLATEFPEHGKIIGELTHE
jgi:hypothetical protein